MNNKTSFLTLVILIAVAAVILVPINVELTASVVFATGLVALVLREYSRKIKPLPLAASGAPRRPALRLAA